MSKQTQSQSNFDFDVIKVLKSDRIDSKNRLDIRIVKWARGNSPVLQKVQVWEKEDGERARKKDWDRDDFVFLMENSEKIVTIL